MVTPCAHEPTPYGSSWVCPACGAVGDLTRRGVLQQFATVPEWRLDLIRRARRVGLPAHASRPDVELVESGKATVRSPLPWDRPYEPTVNHPLGDSTPPDGEQLNLFGDAA